MSVVLSSLVCWLVWWCVGVGVCVLVVVWWFCVGWVGGLCGVRRLWVVVVGVVWLVGCF